MFSLQKFEKERKDLIENKKINGIKKDLQSKKKEVQKIINDYNNKKKQLEIIINDTKKMENENSYLHEEIKRKEESLYENTGAGFKELESIKENIEELKSSYQKREENLLELIVATEDLEKETNLEKKSVNKKKKNFNDEFKIYKEKEKENMKTIEELENTIQKIRKDISLEDIEKYEAMQKKYPFTGIAIIEEGNKCSYCRLDVSVVKLREVERKDITYCESCSRLLIGKIEEIK